MDEYLTRTEGATVQGLLVDALGSTVALTDLAGTAVTAYTYEPFGRTEVTGGGSANEMQFTGRESDGTGPYYYRARYYHATLQRFISEDPLGFASGDVNLYGYVGNSPLRLTDPFGLWDTLTVAGGVIGIGAGGAALATAVAVAPTVATAAAAVGLAATTILATQVIVSGTAEVIVGAIAPPGTEVPPISPIGIGTLIATGGNMRSARAAQAAFSAGKLFVNGIRDIQDLLEAAKLGVEVLGSSQDKPKSQPLNEPPRTGGRK